MPPGARSPVRSDSKRRLRTAVRQRRPLQPSAKRSPRQGRMDWRRNPPADAASGPIRHVALPRAGARPRRGRRVDNFCYSSIPDFYVDSVRAIYLVPRFRALPRRVRRPRTPAQAQHIPHPEASIFRHRMADRPHALSFLVEYLVRASSFRSADDGIPARRQEAASHSTRPRATRRPHGSHRRGGEAVVSRPGPPLGEFRWKKCATPMPGSWDKTRPARDFTRLF